MPRRVVLPVPKIKLAIIYNYRNINYQMQVEPVCRKVKQLLTSYSNISLVGSHPATTDYIITTGLKPNSTLLFALLIFFPESFKKAHGAILEKPTGKTEGSHMSSSVYRGQIPDPTKEQPAFNSNQL